MEEKTMGTAKKTVEGRPEDHPCLPIITARIQIRHFLPANYKWRGWTDWVWRDGWSSSLDDIHIHLKIRSGMILARKPRVGAGQVGGKSADLSAVLPQKPLFWFWGEAAKLLGEWCVGFGIPNGGSA